MHGRLIELLAAASKEERRMAAEQLIELADREPSAVAALRAALTDADPRRRWGATFVLHRTGVRDEGVFGGALTALGSNDGDVRWAAAQIVVLLAASNADRRKRVRDIAADPAAAGRKMALYCLRDLGGNDEDVFVAGLAAPDSRVRLAAVACLGRVPTLSALEVDALLTAVANDTDAGMRRAATVALRGATNDEARVRPVLERLRAQALDPDLARAAERALTALAAARAAK
ncbi:MAG TPA: HEAT repeat domain-containing protein [Candidatus Binatia bacterium]|nr:HEAT repeat domain-containing protein [Candidatus Binatia bacterium]